MNIFRFLPYIFGYVGEESDNIMFGLLLDLGNSFNIEPGFFLNLAQGRFGGNSQTSHCLTSQNLNVQPFLKFVLVRPQKLHLGSGVSFYHFLSLFSSEKDQVKRFCGNLLSEPQDKKSLRYVLFDLNVAESFSFPLLISDYPLSTFFQSSKNLFIPTSVSGCLINWLMTLNGIVAISAPIVAASTTWRGFLTLATMISVVTS